jgi:alcohol dehydrogenase
MSLQIKETEIPALQDYEILVRVAYTTLCKSDILTYTGKRKEKNPFFKFVFHSMKNFGVH